MTNMVTAATETNGQQNTTAKRRGCGCSKKDFLPEESFESWGNYANALKNTKTRFKDRLLTRSQDQLELQQMKAVSQHEMKKTLNWFDIIWFGIGAVMGAGVFVLTGEAARNVSGPAVVVSYFISGFSALLSVLCYTEFSVELPVAGGSFAYLRVELGDFMAFVAAGNILFEYIVAGASVARSWTSYFATLCNHHPEDFRINASFLPENYNQLDPIAVAISLAICFMAALSIKGSSRFNTVTTISYILVIIFIVISGLTKAELANYVPFAPFGIRGTLKASSMLFFAYVGFDGVATLGEEVKNPGRDIPIGLITSMVVIITTYCLLAATLCLMQPYGLIDVDAPFTVAFDSVGMHWAKVIVALGAMMGMTTVLLANILGQARYFTHIARTHMAPPIMASISPKTGTPIIATVVMTFANSVVAFFTSLSVLSSLLSISTLFIFSMVAVALIVRRYYVTGVTSDRDRQRLIVFLAVIIVSSICTSVWWAVDGHWAGYVVTVTFWFMGTLGLKLMVKEAREAKIWGIPLMPWLPSANVAINVFIMGSIDWESFARFSVWTLLLLAYYVFIGLHASYDAAQKVVKESDANLEAGS
ncbi:cationic amino acid transporter 1-like [Impatiens glandulifera]|uniref:cationic amino acid transporter 1-like n=1 Tax=Impatiens glandulifera TaxID=253017 RepID=UPI001FB064AA|nr:cationic amino acid transporter 1-like [Impatiens glandulifera]